MALGGIVTYVFKDHVKRDNDRFTEVKAALDSIGIRQTTLADTMATNHAEILKLLVQAGQQAQTNAAISQAHAAISQAHDRSQS